MHAPWWLIDDSFKALRVFLKSTDSLDIGSRGKKKIKTVERNKEIVNHMSGGEYHNKIYLSDVPKTQGK